MGMVAPAYAAPDLPRGPPLPDHDEVPSVPPRIVIITGGCGAPSGPGRPAPLGLTHRPPAFRAG
eukprot:9116928-Pyramimonas_sp.AAC.1